MKAYVNLFPGNIGGCYHDNNTNENLNSRRSILNKFHQSLFNIDLLIL